MRASGAWLKVADGSQEVVAFVTIDNGTMYDVYVVGSKPTLPESWITAGGPGGKPVTIKEATVPSFGQLEMSADGIHIFLGELNRQIKPGDTVNLSLVLDSGPPLPVQVAVK